MDTVTRGCALKLQRGNGRLPKPKRPWCNAPIGTFTQSTCSPAPYAMRRVLRRAVQPGLPHSRSAQLLHPDRLDPTSMQGNQPLLQEQNRQPHLRLVNQPPAQLQTQRTLPQLSRRRLRPVLAIHCQVTPRGRLHPVRLHLQLPTRSLHPDAQPPRYTQPGKPFPAIRRPVRLDRQPASSRLVG